MTVGDKYEIASSLDHETLVRRFYLGFFFFDRFSFIFLHMVSGADAPLTRASRHSPRHTNNMLSIAVFRLSPTRRCLAFLVNLRDVIVYGGD